MGKKYTKGSEAVSSMVDLINSAHSLLHDNPYEDLTEINLQYTSARDYALGRGIDVTNFPNHIRPGIRRILTEEEKIVEREEKLKISELRGYIVVSKSYKKLERSISERKKEEQETGRKLEEVAKKLGYDNFKTLCEESEKELKEKLGDKGYKEYLRKQDERMIKLLAMRELSIENIAKVFSEE